MNSETEPKPTALVSPRLPYVLISSDADLTKLVQALEKYDGGLAIDAERASGFRYGQKAYLIQIAMESDKIYLLDPIGNYSSELIQSASKLIGDKAWIIHAANQDLECLSQFGLTPRKILDTELAGRLLGYPKVSLGTLCEALLGISLAKEHSAVDWSQRPLPEPWLNYAALDVDVLFDLWRAVEAELVKDGKNEIASQEFQALLTPVEKQEKLDRWRSVTGIHELKESRELTIVRSIWEAREQLAREKDISPGRLIPDSSIIAAVKAKPKSKSELAELRSFSGRASRTYIDTWWEAYQKGLTTKDLVELRAKHVGIPNHRNWAAKFPEAHLRLIWSRKLLGELSVKVSIPTENLISPEALKNICFEPKGVQHNEIKEHLLAQRVRKWQIDLVAPLLAEAFAKQEQPETEETKA